MRHVYVTLILVLCTLPQTRGQFYGCSGNTYYVVDYTYDEPQPFCYPCPQHSSTQGPYGTYCTCDVGGAQAWMWSTCPVPSGCPWRSDVIRESGSIQCVCHAGFSGDGGFSTDSCTACETGKYKESTGNAECVTCDPGKFAGNVASTGCLICPSGSSAPGPDACTQCAPGTISALEGSESCVACGAGEFSENRGSTFCSTCPSGSSAPQPDACTQCAQGTFAAEGSVSCTSCGLGSHTLSAGSDDVSDCICNRGYTVAVDGGIVCTACLSGSYKLWTGNGPCILCATGKYHNV